MSKCFEVTIAHYTAPESHTFEVIAENEDDAESAAMTKALDWFNDWEGEYEVVETEETGDE